jgi:hypothetical protein
VVEDKTRRKVEDPKAEDPSIRERTNINLTERRKVTMARRVVNLETPRQAMESSERGNMTESQEVTIGDL